MNTKMKILLVVLMATGSILTAAAGELEPTAPPGSTMKTLEEVEPRTSIHAADLPLPIDKPGSYYLAENIVTSGGGITIEVSDVTIDLMGLALSGGTGSGISALSGVRNVTVKNGTVRGWNQSGVELGSTTNSLVANVRVEGNRVNGISLGHGAIIDCVALENSWGLLAGSAAIYGGLGTVISRSAARENHLIGFLTAFNATVTHCAAHDNATHGIVAGSGSVVTDCSAGSNGGDGIHVTSGLVRHCTTWGNAGNGIFSGSSSVLGCTSLTNSADGIYALDSMVAENNCSGHVNGAGIRAGFGSTVQGNRVASNEIGIDLISIGNTMFQNTARDNVANYQWTIGNDVGPTGSAATATSPWANIEF